MWLSCWQTWSPGSHVLQPAAAPASTGNFRSEPKAECKLYDSSTRTCHAFYTPNNLDLSACASAATSSTTGPIPTTSTPSTQEEGGEGLPHYQIYCESQQCHFEHCSADGGWRGRCGAVVTSAQRSVLCPAFLSKTWWAVASLPARTQGVRS